MLSISLPEVLYMFATAFNHIHLSFKIQTRVFAGRLGGKELFEFVICIEVVLVLRKHGAQKIIELDRDHKNMISDGIANGSIAPVH